MARFIFYDDKIANILMQDEKPSGGAAVQAYGWIKGLSENGHDVQIITSEIKKDQLKDECKNFTLIPLYDNQKGIRWIRWASYRFPYIFKKIKQSKPDYLYQGIPGWKSFFIGLICRQLNIKYVLRISNDFLLDDRFYINYSKTHRFFQQLGLKLSHFILCQNDYQLNIIKKKFPDKKAYKIANPIFLNSSPSQTQSEIRNYIAWLGLYQYQKNVRLLYEIAEGLPNEMFMVAGKESTKCDEETFVYLEKLKKLSNVKFVGFIQREQVLPFLSNAKYLLNTSHYEGFSNTFLEAMTVGTPIISSEKVNPDNIIDSNKVGIIYKDKNNLLDQFERISDTEYKEMSENAVRYVLENHDYKALANKLINLLNTN